VQICGKIFLLRPYWYKLYTSKNYSDEVRIIMRTITLKLDEELAEAAEQRARLEHTTLEILLSNWLADYAGQEARARRYDEVMNSVRGKVVVGRKLTRDEMNER